MKKLFLAVALLVTSLVASAQHGSFFVQYNSFGLGEFSEVLDDMDAESEKLNGISIGFNKAFAISSSVPLFVEVGAGLTYAWAKLVDEEDEYSCAVGYDDDYYYGDYYYGDYYGGYYGYGCDDEYTVSYKSFSQNLMINVPINLMYKFQLPNSSVTLEPYVGLNLRGHILARTKAKYTYEACCDDMEDVIEEYEEELDKDDLISNYFDKKDMGGKKNVATRFNIGWQVGANVDFGSAFVGVSYGSDFNKFLKFGRKEWKYNAVNVTLGLRF